MAQRLRKADSQPIDVPKAFFRSGSLDSFESAWTRLFHRYRPFLRLFADAVLLRPTASWWVRRATRPTGWHTVSFTSYGGVSAGYVGVGAHFALDNLTINEPFTPFRCRLPCCWARASSG